MSHNDYLRKRYNYMQPVLQKINKRFISLEKWEVKRNNTILKHVMQPLIKKMRKMNPLFKALFSEPYYGGSFYDGLKVGKPEEFDVDLLLTLHEDTEPEVIVSNIPGYIHIRLRGYEDFMKTSSRKWRQLHYLIDNRYYLDATKVLAWMQKVIRKAFNKFPMCADGTAIFNTSYGQFKGKIRRGGPAYTLELSGRASGKSVFLSIDLVSSFVFSEDRWPLSPFCPNPIKYMPDFFVVPKKPSENGNYRRYWRLSFQCQEAELIKGKEGLKPTIRLLKKLQEKLGKEVVSSYYIKTIFLWEIHERSESFWRNSLSYLFITMLRRYKWYLRRYGIPYYWNKRNNLLNANCITIQNLGNRLQHIISDIENNPHDLNIVARHILSPNELNQLRL
ncbi:hypothetical protein ILUMI_08657 [Ignelater luminosus]|uniref:Uncharacterized protein n=1 Tax=Ignelater luminosus TaxID=2038154 RepID=A0A8K0D1H3_IGNLU|nr:hypothetical protein ILUMI_08657 [Ignelater luminosus]